MGRAEGTMPRGGILKETTVTLQTARFTGAFFIASALLAPLSQAEAKRRLRSPSRISNARKIKRGPHYGVPVGKAPVKGPKTALVTVVAYMDFQCPFCERAFNRLLAVQKNHPKDVRLVFKHFPLKFHRQAHLAAQAAVEAQKQKKFWPLAPLIFSARRSLSKSKLVTLAKKAKIKTSKMKKALSSGTYKARVLSEVNEGRGFGVTGTPTIFFNGTRQAGARSKQQYEKLIKKEVAKAKGLLKKKKVTRKNLYTRLVKTGLKRGKKKRVRRLGIKKARGVGIPAGLRSANVSKFHTYSSSIKSKKSLTLGTAPSLGPAGAPVTMIWFGSFNCSSARRALRAWIYVASKFHNKLRLVFKHHIPKNDKVGFFTAQVLREAYAQGMFWEFVRQLVGSYAKSRNTVLKKAAEVGLDMKKLSKAIKDKTHAARVKLDLSEARTHVGRYSRNRCAALRLPNGQVLRGYISGHSLKRKLKKTFKNLNTSQGLLPLP